MTKQMLAASLGVSLLQPIALGAVGSILLGAAAGEVRAQQTLNTEAIGRIAQAITVRIEGATQGSGVLVKREGNLYTVVTAWHVLSGQRPGEEIALTTADRKVHRVELEDVSRIDDADLAVIKFRSSNKYSTADVEKDIKPIVDESIVVAGYPNHELPRLDKAIQVSPGKVVAYSECNMSRGIELLYSGHTLPGMSGGPIIATSGKVIAIHIKGGIPEIQPASSYLTRANIGYGVMKFDSSFVNREDSTRAVRDCNTADDYLMQAFLMPVDAGLDEMNRYVLAGKSLDQRPSAVGHLMRGYSLYEMAWNSWNYEYSPKNAREAIDLTQRAEDEYRKALKLDSTLVTAYISLASLAINAEQREIAVNYMNRAVELMPQSSYLFAIRGIILTISYRNHEAIADLTKALDKGLEEDWVFRNRAHAFAEIGDLRAAFQDVNNALRLGPSDPENLIALALLKGKLGDVPSGCDILRRVMNINDETMAGLFYKSMGCLPALSP